jgi:hypothetical protein
MDTITALLGFLAALSVATERITETIKGFPLLSKWLSTERTAPAGATPEETKKAALEEELRKATIHIIAIGVGTLLAWLVRTQLPAGFPIHITDLPTAVVFGAITSGGSAMWNSALDIVREVNKQKQLLTTQIAGGQPAQANAAAGGH